MQFSAALYPDRRKSTSLKAGPYKTLPLWSANFTKRYGVYY